MNSFFASISIFLKSLRGRHFGSGEVVGAILTNVRFKILDFLRTLNLPLYFVWKIELGEWVIFLMNNYGVNSLRRFIEFIDKMF